MVVRTRFRRAFTILAFHAVVLGASGFFAWHAYTGDRGIIARREHKIRIAQLNRHLDELRFERTAIERRVTELAFEQLDKDLLDERARVLLNLAHRNDLIILTGSK
jgi:cell division protein FtsB